MFAYKMSFIVAYKLFSVIFTNGMCMSKDNVGYRGKDPKEFL